MTDDENRSTSIDLGDDLLKEKTKTVGVVRQSEPQTFDDQLQSAKILMNEGLVEEAKKILRHLMVTDPGYIPVKQALQEIHDFELKQLFGDEPIRRNRRNKDELITVAESQETMKQLDRDLDLGVFSEDGSESFHAQLSLFEDRQALEKFASKIERELAEADASVQDRLDMGIAFLEMGLHDLAAHLLKTAVNMAIGQEPKPTVDIVLSATSLLAYALILSDKAYEATMHIQPVLRDSEIKRESKIELFYLMGRAHESLKQPGLAMQWYQQVREIDPRYRDIEERMRGRQ